MKVFVTGGAGYIGSITVERLLDAGHQVVVFDNLERGHREAVDERARFIQGDLRFPDGVAKAVRAAKPEAVMHFAAYALVGESMERPELYFGNNLYGGLNLLEAMRAAGVRKLVFSSTCATYGFPARVPITEDTPQQPVNPYGESKLLFERVCSWYEKIYGIETAFLRYFNAAGATEKYGEDHEPETHLIPNVLRVALGRSRKIRVFGHDYNTPDGTCIRDYVHISDLAEAHILALENRCTGAFNLGNGRGWSVREVIAAARAVTGRAIPEEQAPRRAGDPDRLIASADRASKELGWIPKVNDIQAIVESAWKWHRAHPNGYA